MMKTMKLILRQKSHSLFFDLECFSHVQEDGAEISTIRNAMTVALFLAKLSYHKGESVHCLLKCTKLGICDANEANGPTNYSIDEKKEHTNALVGVKSNAAHSAKLKKDIVAATTELLVKGNRNVNHKFAFKKYVTDRSVVRKETGSDRPKNKN